ncbi:MAG: alpha/beta hydrolase [Dehalococcoidia bacterium]|nr:alpha/beta hydrolase [Dehalococcoidia bacterium]
MTVEPTTVSVNEGQFNVPVYRAGSGEQLLYIHNAGGMGRGFTPDLERLAASYEVIAPVLPGWDDTDGLQDIDDTHDLVFFLQDLIDALGLKTPVNVLGHSLGGSFAAELAAARPDLVKKLVLVAPTGLWLDESPVADMFSVLPPELPGLLFADPASPVVAELFKPPANQDELAEVMYLQLANFAAAGKFMWPIPDKGLKKRIHRVKAPTLILWGKQDKLIAPAYGPVFVSKIRQSQLVEIDGAGHMLPVEQTDKYVAEVTGFLG